MISAITLDTYKQQINSADAFDLSDSFNGRVGDEQVPLVVQFKERGLAQRFEDGLVPFLTGFVGSLDENDQVTAETGEAVSYVGTSDDIVGLGRVKMNLPGTMFPQEGYFYGFLGLQNADGKRVTTFNIWFHVYNGNPDMFVNKAPFRAELQKVIDKFNDLLASNKDTFSTSMNDWKQQVTALLTDLNGDYAKVQTTVNLIQQQLTTLEAQIKSDGLLKQADLDGKLDEFNKQIQAELKAGIGALDSEVVIARGGHNNLSDRLNEMEDGYGQVNKAIPDSTLQEAYKAGIDRTKSKMKSTDFNIGFITDTHWEENYDANRPYDAYGRTKYYDSLNHLSNIQQLDGLVDTFICGGDNTESGSRSLDIIKKQSEIFALKASTVESDHFMLLGNHDQGSSRLINYGYKKDQLPFDDYIHQDEIKELWSINDNENGELRDGDSLYFYKDYPDKKIRLIGINTNDDPEIKTDGGYEQYLPIWLEAVRQKQLDWLANTALQNVPEDYHVVVFGHAHLDPSLDGSNPNNPERHVNFDILLNLLNAFKNGQNYSGVSSIADFKVSVNAEFSGQGPRTLVGYFCGHVHQQIVNEYAGIKNYIFDNSFFEDTDDGTEKQDSWAVIAIDTANRKIKIYGFGRTTDQTYDY
ncbi:metallophosphoesterase family protein [Lactiplantibacillus paraplantarum]|uniref:metallophosphoesterase family protein n=1 Tax=Lactiplantibacillus paraplantarum TaxID=60520 RepID=UPI0020745B7D|nr:metallophosphoesterase [Lactiplantibacillus paraplantarum]